MEIEDIDDITDNDNIQKQYYFESYIDQTKNIWPGKGKHILAQFDDNSIVVYQAFNSEIAEYAVKNKKFTGCLSYNYTRMTWIKPNFMWMMYRSGWGSKPNQSNILAIWLKLEVFERYLENAKVIITNKKLLKQKSKKINNKNLSGSIYVQWDPDHDHRGDNHPYRKALQIGLKNIHSFINGDDIIDIQDISNFVYTQRIIAKNKKNKDIENLIVAKERIYIPTSKVAIENVELTVS